MSFTKEELEAVGAIPEWVDGTGLDDLWNDHWSQILGKEVHEHRATLLRLALAHPERAALALGEGWRVGYGVATDDGSEVPYLSLDADPVSLLVQPGGVMFEIAPRRTASCAEVPPAFDAALARARRIAAAWKRIEGKS